MIYLGKRRVLVTASRYTELCAEAKKLLESKGFEIVENTSGKRYTKEELISIVPNIDAAIVGMDKWDRDVFNAAKKLKVIAKFGVGYDNIDVEAASDFGIKVTFARGQNAVSVAELTLTLLLSVIKNIPYFNNHVKEGIWDRELQYEIRGKTVGLIGFGCISQETAKMLMGFGVNVLAADLKPNEKAAKMLNVTLTDIDTIIEQSDIISLHIPGTKENTHIINKDAMSRMKENVILINTSRGNLINLTDLHAMILDGKILGAGLDCFESEPVSQNTPILGLDRVVCTPHSGGKTYEAYQRISGSTAKAVIDFFDGIEPENLIN